jgi:hypothetical protein
VNVKAYVEGGGDTKALKTKCRQGFSEFFRKAGLVGRMPRIVASGSRRNAYEDCCTALKKAAADEFIGLLVDSEDAVAAGVGSWAHVKNYEGWDKPAAADDRNAHLMVRCMEAWFVADRDALAEFFGQGFNAGVLPARHDVENITKPDLYAALENATRSCRKGRYGKGRHAFDILARLNPERVMAASPHARRLVVTLMDKA